MITENMRRTYTEHARTVGRAYADRLVALKPWPWSDDWLKGQLRNVFEGAAEPYIQHVKGQPRDHDIELVSRILDAANDGFSSRIEAIALSVHFHQGGTA